MNHTEYGTVAIGSPNSIMRRITEQPEPIEESRTDYNVSTSTPWGVAQTAKHFGRGIVQYSTAGHGGFHVSAGLLKQMPEYLQTADLYASGADGWFEEDCAWAIVAVCFPERFPQQARLDAVRTMQSTYPEQWERFVNDTL
jgi:hypothetical protein